MKGASITGWAKNALANPEVRLRIRGGNFTGRARELQEAEMQTAGQAYCGTVNPFDYGECMLWRTGRPTRSKIQALHREWFETGTPLVVELVRSDRGG